MYRICSKMRESITVVMVQTRWLLRLADSLPGLRPPWTPLGDSRSPDSNPHANIPHTF